MQTVKVFGVQDRRTTTQAKLPWVVRYAIDGRHRSKSFRTRIEAERYRGSLLQAVMLVTGSTSSPASPSRGSQRCVTSVSTSGRGVGWVSNGRSGSREPGRRRPKRSPGSSRLPSNLL
jgi:hypothetical protein